MGAHLIPHSWRGARCQRQVHNMLALAKKWTQDEGKARDELLLDVIYDESASTRDRLAAIKLWKACTMVKLSEDSMDNIPLSPGIYLPEEKPDPAV